MERNEPLLTRIADEMQLPDSLSANEAAALQGVIVTRKMLDRLNVPSGMVPGELSLMAEDEQVRPVPVLGAVDTPILEDFQFLVPEPFLQTYLETKMPTPCPYQ